MYTGFHGQFLFLHKYSEISKMYFIRKIFCILFTMQCTMNNDNQPPTPPPSIFCSSEWVLILTNWCGHSNPFLILHGYFIFLHSLLFAIICWANKFTSRKMVESAVRGCSKSGKNKYWPVLLYPSYAFAHSQIIHWNEWKIHSF